MLNMTTSIGYTQRQLEASAVLPWLVQRFAEWLELDAREIDATQPVSRYGLDSISVVTISVYLEDELGISLDTAVLWDHPTLEALAEHLTQELARNGVTELPRDSN